MSRRPIKRALISVYDKTGLIELARDLTSAGVEIVSTGSTAATISGAGMAVTPVSEVTGFPEILGGRVKTLHPAIHAGLLANLDDPEHEKAIADLGIEAFELVVVNLYPFAATVASGAADDEIIEQIDIGGPSMVRAAAKNHTNVAVIVSPSLYSSVRLALDAGGFTLAERQKLAALAFQHTATYDISVAGWFAATLTGEQEAFPSWTGGAWSRQQVLRYGENPHQAAVLYDDLSGQIGLAQAEQLHGKQMSYNNYVDTDSARRAAYDFAEPCVAIIKHANPCGIAIGRDIADAYVKAHSCDPTSAYGGVIATNRPVTMAMARAMEGVFTEVICAPAFEEDALVELSRRKGIRILRCAPVNGSSAVEYKKISGGLLLQEADRIDTPGDDPANWELKAGHPVDEATLAELEFAWRAIRSVKSNAILLAREGATIGIGMGQVNRVDSARLAVARGGERVAGSVGASDAFFPFADGLEILIEAGVRAVVEPGGSIRDDEVIEAARKAGLSLYFTGTRHFTHG